MSPRRLILAWLLLAWTSLAAGEPAPGTGWYRGLLGRTATDLDNAARYEQNKEVELRLDADGSRVTGHYFYFDTGHGSRGNDIPFRGTQDRRGAIRLEERGDGDRVTGTWAGTLDGDVFSGTWTDPAGKRRLRFFLRQLPDLEGDEQEVAPGLAYRPRRVRGTNLALPFVSRHPDPGVLKKLNEQIQAWFGDSRCSPAVDFPGWPDGYQVDWKVAYASNDLLSVAVSEDSFCGGPYPNSADRSFTFDLRTGNPVEFESLFRNFEKDGDAILETLFADALKSASQECKEFRADRAEQDPRPDPYLLGGRLAFSLSRTALTVQETDLPHAIQGCAVSATVPYDKLRRFAAPDGPISRILDRKPPSPR